VSLKFHDVDAGLDWIGIDDAPGLALLSKQTPYGTTLG